MDEKKSFINFYELFKNGGFYTTDENGNEILNEEKILSEIGISLASAEGFINGTSNPQRGKNFTAIVEYFELDPIHVKAFLKWRGEKWKAWEDAGFPETGPTADFKDEDYAGEYYDELKAKEVPAETAEPTDEASEGSAPADPEFTL